MEIHVSEQEPEVGREHFKQRNEQMPGPEVGLSPGWSPERGRVAGDQHSCRSPILLVPHSGLT